MRVGFAPFMHDLFDHELLEVPLPPEIRRRLDAAPARTRPAPSGSTGTWPPAGTAAPAASRSCWDRTRSSAARPRCGRCGGASADELGLAAHTHLAETRAQGAYGQQQWPGGTVAEMDRQGLLSERLSVAHGIWLSPPERELLARRGVTVVHNPASNLMLGSGRHAPGGRPGPGRAARPRHRLVEHRRPARSLRGHAARPDAPASRHAGTPGPGRGRPSVLAMATRGGARALGLAGQWASWPRGTAPTSCSSIPAARRSAGARRHAPPAGPARQRRGRRRRDGGGALGPPRRAHPGLRRGPPSSTAWPRSAPSCWRLRGRRSTSRRRRRRTSRARPSFETASARATCSRGAARDASPASLLD